MSERTKQPIAVTAASVPPRTISSILPEPFASRMSRRVRRPLGDLFGLKNFGVNLTRMAPGAVSSLHHSHTRQDEFLYVLEGEPTLLTDGDKVKLAPGMCAGFPANGPAHHLENRTDKEVLVLEIGDRVADDQLLCPNDDLATVVGPDGKWRFTHKDGRPY